MSKVSIIVPSLYCQYAARTVDDLVAKATGEVEIIVLLDDWWPDPPLNYTHKNLVVVHKGKRTGLRDSVNLGAKIATGKYLLKCDDHCIFGEGYDELLQKDHQPDWLSVPSKFSIDAINWKPVREAVEYEYMAYPYSTSSGIGLYSKKWLGENGGDPINMGYDEFYKRERQRKHIIIDDIMIFQGSCWFMEKSHFEHIGGLFDYKTMYQEPQEMCFKTWLSGGRCIVNKNTWYAHMYKGKDLSEVPHARGYKLDLTAMRETERYGTWYWATDQWPLATRKFEWLVEKFWPISGWPDNWKEERDKFYERYGLPTNPVGEIGTNAIA